MIEVGKSKERLSIFDFSQFRPVLDNFYFVVSHDELKRGKDISKVFYQLGVKFTFFGFYIKSNFLQIVKDFFDILSKISHVIRIDQKHDSMAFLWASIYWPFFQRPGSTCGIKIARSGLSFLSFAYFMFFSIYILYFLFIELRVRVSHVTQEEKCRRYQKNDIIQHV